jgi:hypothetical protein
LPRHFVFFDHGRNKADCNVYVDDIPKEHDAIEEWRAREEKYDSACFTSTPITLK